MPVSVIITCSVNPGDHTEQRAQDHKINYFYAYSKKYVKNIFSSK